MASFDGSDRYNRRSCFLSISFVCWNLLTIAVVVDVDVDVVLGAFGLRRVAFFFLLHFSSSFFFFIFLLFGFRFRFGVAFALRVVLLFWVLFWPFFLLSFARSFLLSLNRWRVGLETIFICFVSFDSDSTGFYRVLLGLVFVLSQSYLVLPSFT